MSQTKINNDALEEFLASDVGDFLKATKSIDNTVKEMQVAQSAGLPTPEGVTAALEGFLEQGQSVLETMTIYCNNMPDAESVNSFASLMNAMSSAINKIAALYKTEQQHRNRIELEEKKHELKMKEIAYKESFRTRKGDGEEIIVDENGNAETMIPVSTADIVAQFQNTKN
jgi:hypothetical protein